MSDITPGRWLVFEELIPGQDFDPDADMNTVMASLHVITDVLAEDGIGHETILIADNLTPADAHHIEQMHDRWLAEQEAELMSARRVIEEAGHGWDEDAEQGGVSLRIDEEPLTRHDERAYRPREERS